MRDLYDIGVCTERWCRVMTRWFQVGKIIKPHGLKGEVCVLSDTDFPDERYAKGNTLYMEPADADGGDRIPLVVAGRRRHQQFELLSFEGYHHINDVEPLRGAVLKVPEDQLSELPEDEYYYHEIIGCRVVTDEGTPLGKVKEILAPGANDVWVVETASGKDILIPYIREVVTEVDVDRQRIEIHPLEGLIE